MSLKSIIRSVYNATSDSSSKLGRFGRWAFPYNGQYFVRDAWRKYGKNLFGSPTSAGGLVSSGSGSVYGPTGSIVGRY